MMKTYLTKDGAMGYERLNFKKMYTGNHLSMDTLYLPNAHPYFNYDPND